MTMLTYLSAGIFALIGILHIGLALYDFSAEPRFFRPHDDEALEALKKTYIETAGDSRDYWTSTLGVHLCHAVGVILFAILIVLEDAYEITGLRPLLALVGAGYSLVAWRFWSRRPVSASMIGTILLCASWI